MTSTDPAALALLVATAVHAGFQVTVTIMVYPALVRLGPDRWEEGHRAHARAITPLVGLVYPALGLACGWALLESPASPGVLVSVGSAGTAVLLTAVVAAPTHGRLVTPEPALLRRLLRADRGRSLAALAALAGAVLHAA